MNDNDITRVEDDVSQPQIASEMTGAELALETPGVSQGISREDGAIGIINLIQNKLVQYAINNNTLSVAGPDRTP